VTLPGNLPADSVTGGQFTAAEEDQVEIAVNEDTAVLRSVEAVMGVIKSDGAGGFTAAAAGTDFAPKTVGTALLKGGGTGGFANAVAGLDYMKVVPPIIVTGSLTLPASLGVIPVIVQAGGLPMMPTAVGNTDVYLIKNASGGLITLATTSSQPIDGTAIATTLYNLNAIMLVSDGTTGWWIF
jgi:hypothetical protein